MIGTMRSTNPHPTVPIGVLNFPRCHGPLRNLSPTKKMRIMMGMVKATYAAIAAMENKAPAAMGPPKMRRVERMPMVMFAMTAFTGVLVCGFTCFQMCERGKQSSRE